MTESEVEPLPAAEEEQRVEEQPEAVPQLWVVNSEEKQSVTRPGEAKIG